MGNKHVISDLYQMQSLSLRAKIGMTKRRINEWVDMYGEDGVYVSFSGGKDSTVLLDIARQLYPNIKAVFVDTGLEYPEIRLFVKTVSNVDWIRPKLTFRQVIEKYGYPFISKEVSECVYGAKKFLRGGGTANSTVSSLDAESMRKITPGGQTTSIENLGDWESIPVRVKILFGAMTKGNIPNGERSKYSCERYKFFIDCPYEISSECCKVMKKAPAHSYAKSTGRKPMTAQMATESRLRTQQWLKNGCNGFDMKSPISNPMSFWTEQDVLTYIRLYGDDMVRRREEQSDEYMRYGDRYVSRKTGATMQSAEIGRPICSVYGEIVTEDEEHGQMTLADVTDLLY